MSIDKQLEQSIINSILTKLKSDDFKNRLESGMDIVTLAMEEAEKTKKDGKTKSMLVQSVIPQIMMNNKDLLPEHLAKQVSDFVDSGLLPSIINTISKASKQLFGINLEKKMKGCFGNC